MFIYMYIYVYIYICIYIYTNMDYLTMWESGMNSPAKGGAASGGFFSKPCWEWQIDSWMEPQVIDCFSFPRKRYVPMEVTLSARVWQPFLVDHQADFY